MPYPVETLIDQINAAKGLGANDIGALVHFRLGGFMPRGVYVVTGCGTCEWAFGLNKGTKQRTNNALRALLASLS